MVTCWLLIDTIAMIGSPAARGAAASLARTGAVCFTAAVADGAAASATSAAVAASVTIAGAHPGRIAAGKCAVLTRFVMPCSGSNASTRQTGADVFHLSARRQ